MPVKKPTALPKPEKVVVAIAVKANLGSYESLEVKIEETYSVPSPEGVDEFRNRVGFVLRDQLHRIGSALVEDVTLRTQGQNPAGEVALLFKHITDSEKLS